MLRYQRRESPMSSTLTPATAKSAPIEPTAVESAIVESVTADASPTAPDPRKTQGPNPDVSHLATEDDTSVDNLIQEKLQRFLVECLYSSLKLGVPFLAAADVGLVLRFATEGCSGS